MQSSGASCRENAKSYPHLSMPREGGHPVRRGLSAQAQAPLNTGSSAFAAHA